MSRFSRMSALVVLAIVVTVPLAAQHNPNGYGIA